MRWKNQFYPVQLAVVSLDERDGGIWKDGIILGHSSNGIIVRNVDGSVRGYRDEQLDKTGRNTGLSFVQPK